MHLSVWFTFTVHASCFAANVGHLCTCTSDNSAFLFSFTCRMERITLQEMWKYMNYQASGGYSIAAINVVNFMYEYNFITLPRLTTNFIWLHGSCVFCAPLHRCIGRYIDRYMGRVSVDILTDTQPICRSTYRPTLDGHINRDMSVDMSVEISADMSVEISAAYRLNMA